MSNNFTIIDLDKWHEKNHQKYKGLKIYSYDIMYKLYEDLK